MSAMKRILEWVLEEYESGRSVKEIAQDTQEFLTEDQVYQIVKEYFQETV
jgi:urease gamma subunit